MTAVKEDTDPGLEKITPRLHEFINATLAMMDARKV